jgi:hypothetical protein
MAELVERLLSIPPYTEAVGRFYSRLGFMQRPHRGNLSVEMRIQMTTANAWLVPADPRPGKPPHATRLEADYSTR